MDEDLQVELAIAAELDQAEAIVRDHMAKCSEMLYGESWENEHENNLIRAMALVGLDAVANKAHVVSTPSLENHMFLPDNQPRALKKRRFRLSLIHAAFGFAVISGIFTASDFFVGFWTFTLGTLASSFVTWHILKEEQSK
jgi:hypothetical protein